MLARMPAQAGIQCPVVLQPDRLICDSDKYCTIKNGSYTLDAFSERVEPKGNYGYNSASSHAMPNPLDPPGHFRIRSNDPHVMRHFSIVFQSARVQFQTPKPQKSLEIVVSRGSAFFVTAAQHCFTDSTEAKQLTEFVLALCVYDSF